MRRKIDWAIYVITMVAILLVMAVCMSAKRGILVTVGILMLGLLILGIYIGIDSVKEYRSLRKQ